MAMSATLISYIQMHHQARPRYNGCLVEMQLHIPASNNDALKLPEKLKTPRANSDM